MSRSIKQQHIVYTIEKETKNRLKLSGLQDIQLPFIFFSKKIWSFQSKAIKESPEFHSFSRVDHRVDHRQGLHLYTIEIKSIFYIYHTDHPDGVRYHGSRHPGHK